MSAAPTPGPRESKQQQQQQRPAQSPQEPRPKPKPVLIFDDPLDQQSADDTDRGWGERPSGGSAADLARFLDEKPPHHI
ncbi:hypothetical protein [Streptomyces sp. CA-146814]|uniref:hypothetical protein n=1 Tax=Streptomyces sp. CA-146814 TaxID=3240053 RepID=UPI003D8ED8D9